MATCRANTVINLPTHNSIVTATSDNQRSPSPEDSLVNSEEDSLSNHDQPSQSLDDSQPDSEEENSVDIPIEMEPVQLMNQLLTQLATKSSTKIHPTPFAGTAA